MPLQNRVTPEGEIVAVAARGTFMGNRGGQLHGPDRRLGGRRWTSKAWITCLLAWKGRREVIMAPGHYTQLFFLDEATALAAGHRPCALCRPEDFRRFRQCWDAALGLAGPSRAPEIDARLHGERLGPGRQKATWRGRLADLPGGVMVRHGGSPCLRWHDRLWVWSAAGYRPSGPAEPRAEVEVLTPASTVAALSAGYQPVVHASAAIGR